MGSVSAVVSVGVSAVACFALMHLLRLAGLVDVPVERSSHSVATLRGGGIAVMIGALSGALTQWQMGGRAGAAVLVAAIGCGTIGLGDDLVHGASVLLRLVLQVAVILLAVVLALEKLSGPWMWQVFFGLACAVAVIGFVNAFNFMDGINGVSVAETLVGGATFFLIGRHYGSHVVTQGGLVIAAAALGFLPFNFPRAHLFLGDVGSYFLGGWLILLALSAVRVGVPIEAAAGPLVIYVADAGWTLLGRVRRGDRWYAPHREHVYQRLAQRWDHARATAVVFAATATCAALGAISIRGGVAMRVSADLIGLAVIVVYLALPGLLDRPVRSLQPVQTR